MGSYTFSGRSVLDVPPRFQFQLPSTPPARTPFPSASVPAELDVRRKLTFKADMPSYPTYAKKRIKNRKRKSGELITIVTVVIALLVIGSIWLYASKTQNEKNAIDEYSHYINSVKNNIALQWEYSDKFNGRITRGLDFKITNNSSHTVQDVRLEIAGKSKTGTPLQTRHEILYEIFQSGTSKKVSIPDHGITDPKAYDLSIVIIGGKINN